jgi:hypothetical protein
LLGFIKDKKITQKIEIDVKIREKELEMKRHMQTQIFSRMRDEKTITYL